MATTITMPALGESVAEGEIGKWLVEEGQQVQKNQPLVEILTDKADSEIPASEDGVITKIFAQVGDIVSVGDNLCEIDANAQASASADDAGENKHSGEKKHSSEKKQSGENKQSKASDKAAPKSKAAASAKASGKAKPSSERPALRPSASTGGGAAVHASPSVRKFAREQGVDLRSLGDESPLSKADVLRAKSGEGGASAKGNGKGGVAQLPPDHRAQAKTSGAFKLPPYTPRPGDQVIPFTRRRRIIADHMVYSKLNAPHVVTFSECDIHATSKLRNEHKKEFKAAGLNLTFLSFVCAATAKALTEFPELNSRVMDDAYVLLREINLGIAVETDDGLVVPVIRGADELSVRGVARAIDELAEKARSGNLAPDDLANKTFTVSNPGRQGNLVGGAIISQPNVGILRMGEIKKRVVVVERDGEDLMAIHPVMYMALSYDHRVVDGVKANAFLWRISQILEEADFEL